MLALVAFAGFPLGDAVIKSMAGDWPAPAVAALRFTIGALALAVILFVREGRRGFQVNRPWLHMARGFALFVGTISFFSAIYIMPLADAVAISFINPILTALFSGWFLRENMPPRTWVATIIAFGGVLIMLRPNVSAFGWVAILPLISAFAMSTMLILNRMVSTQRSIFAAQFYIAFWAAIFPDHCHCDWALAGPRHGRSWVAGLGRCPALSASGTDRHRLSLPAVHGNNANDGGSDCSDRLYPAADRDGDQRLCLWRSD